MVVNPLTRCLWSVVLVRSTHRPNHIWRDPETGILKSEPSAPQPRRRSFGPKQVPRRPYEPRPQAITGRSLSQSHRRRVRRRRQAKRERAAQRRQERLTMSEADKASLIVRHDLAVLKCVNSYPRLRRYDISLYRQVLDDQSWEHNGGKYVDL